MHSRESSMKMRLLSVLILAIFATGCKAEKKEDNESPDPSTVEAEAGEASEDISCGDIYDKLLKISETDDVPPKSQFITICEKSSPEQRTCIASATSIKGPGPNSVMGCVLKSLGIEKPNPEENNHEKREKAAEEAAAEKETGDASCSAVYDKFVDMMKAAGGPEAAITGELIPGATAVGQLIPKGVLSGQKEKFVADCEKESTAAQRNCIVKSNNVEAAAFCLMPQ
jgi:hypothetical protein